MATKKLDKIPDWINSKPEEPKYSWLYDSPKPSTIMSKPPIKPNTIMKSEANTVKPVLQPAKTLDIVLPEKQKQLDILNQNINKYQPGFKAIKDFMTVNSDKPRQLSEEERQYYANNPLAAWFDRVSKIGGNLMFGVNDEAASTGNQAGDISANILGNVVGFATPNPVFNGQSWSGALNQASKPVENYVANKLSNVGMKELPKRILPIVAREGAEDVAQGLFNDIGNNKPVSEILGNIPGNFATGGAFGGLINLPGVAKDIKLEKAQNFKNALQSPGNLKGFNNFQAKGKMAGNTADTLSKLEAKQVDNYLNNVEGMDYTNSLDPAYVKAENKLRLEQSKKPIANVGQYEIPMGTKTTEFPKVTIEKERITPMQQSLITHYSQNGNIDDDIAGVQKIIDDKIEAQYQYLKANSKKGVDQGALIRDQYGDVTNRLGRGSLNDEWYREFYRKNGHAPTQKELRQLSEQMLDEGYKDWGQNLPPDKALMEAKETLKDLKTTKKYISKYPQAKKSDMPLYIKNTVKTVNKVETPIIKKIDYVKYPDNSPYSITPKKIEPILKPIDTPKLQPAMDEAAVALEKPNMIDMQPAPKPKLELVPDNANVKERGFSENVRTDYSMEDDIRKSFDDEPLFYKQLKNKGTLEKAQAVYDKGYDYARSYWIKNADTLDPSDVPLSRLIANEATKRGDVAFARDVISSTAEKLTKAGQYSQAANILRESDPATFLTFIQKQLNKLNTDGAKKYGKKWNIIQLADNDITTIGGMSKLDNIGKDSIMEDLYKRISSQIPSSNMEKFDSWRRMSMLLNPKTHVRNVLGNTIMMGMRKVADTTGAGIEKLLDFKPGERTKSFLWSKNKKVVDLVNADWEVSKKDLLGSGRWDIENLNFLNSDKNVFKNKALNALDKFSKDTLNAEDSSFVQRAYKDSLGQYLQANKLEAVTDTAKAYAKRRAYEATFKQSNMLSTFISKAKQTGAGKLVEAAIPFSKTPSNIALRAFEYSPAGLTKLLFSKGKTPAMIVETLSKGLTGTAIAGLGYLLAANGWGRSENNKNKNAEAILQQSGEQPYSISTPQGSYTFDWAQPFSVPFAMGMTLFESLNKRDDIDIEGITDAVAAGGDTIFNMSMLRNIKDLLGGGFGSPTESIMGLPVSYIEQAFPTIFGQVARSVDDTKRSTYDPNPLNLFTNQLKAKTPLLSKTLEPKLDVFGKEQKQDSPILQFLSPGYSKGKTNDEATNEIARLYKAEKDSSILPKVAPTTITSNKKEIQLTPQEVTEYQRVMGQKNFTDINMLVNSWSYKNMSDTYKAKAMRDIVNKNYDYTEEIILQKRLQNPLK